MHSDNDPVLIYSTSPSLEVAERIAGELVQRGQAACVNILPTMVSIYSWEGKVARDSEVAVLVKTRSGAVNDVIGTIKALHPYDVPAALAFPASGGLPEFCDWIADQTGGNRIKRPGG